MVSDVLYIYMGIGYTKLQAGREFQSCSLQGESVQRDATVYTLVDLPENTAIF